MFDRAVLMTLMSSISIAVARQATTIVSAGFPPWVRFIRLRSSGVGSEDEFVLPMRVFNRPSPLLCETSVTDRVRCPNRLLSATSRLAPHLRDAPGAVRHL